MVAQPRFCGRCGAQVAPGAAYCGRCGAPQPAQAAAAVAPYVYTYRPSAPGPSRGAGGFKMSQIAVGVVLVAILLIATIGISAFAVSKALGTPHATCTANCGAKIVTPLPAANTYRSSAFKYEVDYPPDWTVRSQDANGVSFATRIGRLDIVGTKAIQSPEQTIQAMVAALPSSAWQNVSAVSDLKGAHIGDQDGLGVVYQADLLGSNATAAKVRFVVIAAARGGLTVALFAVNPADPKNFPNGIPEGRDFDYLLQEFRWAAG